MDAILLTTIYRKNKMKTFLKYIILAIMSLTASNAIAAAITGHIFNTGDYQIIGSIYIDTTDDADFTRGIGSIETIKQSGTTVWSSSDNNEFMNFYFDEIETNNIIANPVGTSTFFDATGGIVNFYLNSTDVFDASQDFDTQKTAYESGTLFIEAVGVGTTAGFFSTTGGTENYAANGFLDVIGGTDMELFDTSGIMVNSSGLIADMTFNISADNLHEQGINGIYNWSGSTDLNGAINNVPEPMPIALIGLGLIGLTGIKRLT